MSAWIGPLGSLIEFKCPSAVESSSEDSHVYFKNLGGDVSVTTLGDGTRPRVWDVSVSAARPDHVAALQALSEGEFGPGPFVFIPPAAQSLNLLSKRVALSIGPTNTKYGHEGPGIVVTTTEGPAGTAYVALGPETPGFMHLGSAPILPGVPVTGRAWVQARAGTTAQLRMVFYTAGQTVTTITASASTTSTVGEFLHITATPPPGAAYAIVETAGALITRPQITWTAEPRTWSPSAASQNVVVSPLSDSVRRATGRVGEEQITDHRFTVTELRA